MRPEELRERFADMLVDAGLPRWDSARHLPETSVFELGWSHGLRLHFDLTRREIDPIDVAS
jgi:hypothetical protein